MGCHSLVSLFVCLAAPALSVDVGSFPLKPENLAATVARLVASSAAHDRTLSDLVGAQQKLANRISSLEEASSKERASTEKEEKPALHKRKLLSPADGSETRVSRSGINTCFLNVTCQLNVEEIYWRGQRLGFDPPTGYPTLAPTPLPSGSPTNIPTTAVPTPLPTARQAWVFPGDQLNFYFIRNEFTWPSVFTLQMWVKPLSFESRCHFFSYASASSYNCLLLRNDMFDSSHINKWTYVVVTYDGSSSRAYLDGSFIGSAFTGFGPFCGVHTGSVVIGQEQDSVGGGFSITQASNTHQDSVAIYSRVFSSSEIAVRPTCVDLSDPSLYTLWGDDGTDLTNNGWSGSVTTDGFVDGISCI